MEDAAAVPHLRRILDLCKLYDIELVARWCPRELNMLCDAGSKEVRKGRAEAVSAALSPQ